MTQGIARIPQMADFGGRTWLSRPSSIAKLRSFASFVAHEETFTASYCMQQGVQQPVEQKILCVSKSKIEEQKVGGAWTSFCREALEPQN
jgi:hypothetical protein